MQKVLFIPGYGETLRSRDYRSTIAAIKDRGYAVEFVDISWTRTTIEDWVAEFEKELEGRDVSKLIFAGFSYGAMTALLAATKKSPSALWLFSLSPYFASDIPKLRKSWLREIGPRRVRAFEKLDFKRIAAGIKAPTLIMYGEVEGDEWPVVVERATEAHEYIPGSTLIRVEGAGHDVADPAYIAAIHEAI